MLNTNQIGVEKWSNYRVSIDEIEKRTGLDFLSRVPLEIQESLEKKTDMQTIQALFTEQMQ